MSDYEIFSRNELFWGKEFQSFLAEKHVAVFGLGGVGGFCADSLVRAGVGELTIVDFDKVSLSNINRQLVALHSSVGVPKAKILEQRLKDINPVLKLHVVDDFYNGDNLNLDFDFVADAIDTMRAKISLLENCVKAKVPVVSSMGAGNRFDPTKLYICDLDEIENKNAPFVSNVLYQLKKRGISSGIRVVASREKPFSLQKLSNVENITTKSGENIEFNKITPGSTPFVVATAGLLMGYEIIRILREGQR